VGFLNMDVKALLLGIIAACLFVGTMGLFTFDGGSVFGTDTTYANSQFNNTMSIAQSNLDDMNSTATSMRSLFDNRQPSTLGALNDLYEAGGGIVRLSLGSIGLVTSFLMEFAVAYPEIAIFLGVAVVAFVVMLLLSIAYLVLFHMR